MVVASLGLDGRVPETSRWPSLLSCFNEIMYFPSNGHAVPYPREGYIVVLLTVETEPDDLQIVNSTLFQPVFSASLPVPNEVLGS